MNTRDLEYLIAVTELKHFGRAAEACFVSQPALSMQINKLEATLGIKLFERSNKQVIPTPEGLEITRRAKNILREIEEMKTAAASLQDPAGGSITLGAFPTLAPYFLPQAIKAIRRKLPKLRVLLLEDKTDALLQKLKDGEIDATLTALPLDEETLSFESIRVDPFYFATHVDNPLAKHRSIHMADLKNETLMLLDEGHCLRTQALTLCQKVEAKENDRFRATSLETLREMVAGNIGSTLIPKMAIRESDDIRYIPFQKPAPCREIVLAWRKTSPRHECFKTLCRVLRQVK